MAHEVVAEGEKEEEKEEEGFESTFFGSSVRVLVGVLCVRKGLSHSSATVGLKIFSNLFGFVLKKCPGSCLEPIRLCAEYLARFSLSRSQSLGTPSRRASSQDWI